MINASVFDAKTNLSKYIAAILNKEEPFVIIMRNGKPVARLVPYEAATGNRIGAGKNIIPMMKSLDEFNSIDVEDDFSGNGGLLQ